MPRREVDIQLSILHYLRNIGAYGGKTKTLGVKRGRSFCYDPYTFRGKSDLECFYKGVMYAIEVKRPPNKIKKDSPQDDYRKAFHKPPDRIFIEANSVDDVMVIIH